MSSNEASVPLLSVTKVAAAPLNRLNNRKRILFYSLLFCLGSSFVIYRILLKHQLIGFSISEQEIKVQLSRADIKMKNVLRSNEVNMSQHCRCEDTRSGVVYDFCYYQNETFHGREFLCKYLVHLKALKFLERDENDNDTVVREPLKMPENPPIVTAASDNHLTEVMEMIGQTQKRYPNTKIIFYDLGMTSVNEKLVRSFCQVEYRPFPFERFPQYFSDLHNYRWKVLINALMMNDYPTGFFYLDAHIRWGNNTIDELIRHAVEDKQMSLVLALSIGNSIFSVTDPAMYSYLPIDKEEAKAATQHEAGFQFIIRTRQTMKIYRWLVLCALQEDCMGPECAQMGCFFRHPMNDYAHCHRFDQSAINIILYNEYQGNYTQFSIHNNDHVQIGLEPGFEDCAFETQFKRSKICPYPGQMAEIVHSLMKEANVSFTLHRITNEMYEALGGEYLGAYALLSNYTYDLILPVQWFVTEERLNMGFQFTVDIDPNRQLYALTTHALRRKDISGSLSVYFGLYSFHAWMLFGLIAIIYKLTRHFCRENLSTTITAMFGGLWLLLYGNTLAARILFTEDFLPFHNYKEMLTQVNKGAMRLTIEPETGWFIELMRSNSTTNTMFRQTMIANTPLYSDWVTISDINTDQHLFAIVDFATAQSWRNDACGSHLDVIGLEELGTKASGLMFAPRTPNICRGWGLYVDYRRC